MAYTQKSLFFLIFLVFIVFENSVNSSEIEEQLLRNLFVHYDKTVRPANPDQTIAVQIAFQLKQIDFDDSKGLFNAAAHFFAKWEDPKLKWTPSEYGNISKIHLKQHEVWLPDVSLYNSLGNKALDILDSGIMTLENSGIIVWNMDIRLKTLCDLDMFHWPHDTHKCIIKLGSWTYDGLLLDLYPSKKIKPISEFIENPEFVITNFTTHRETTFYVCCSEPYITLEYYIEFTRRFSAFSSVFLMPAFCVVIMTLAAFWIPPHRGEKILLNGFTLILILMYQLYFIANHSTFSLRLPLIAIFYSISFVLVTLSMVISVLVLAASRSLCKGRLPPRLSNILKSKVGIMFGPVDDSKKPDQTDMSNHFEGDKMHETFSLIATNSSYDEWTALGIVFDRVSFVVYSGIYALVGLMYYL